MPAPKKTTSTTTAAEKAAAEKAAAEKAAAEKAAAEKAAAEKAAAEKAAAEKAAAEKAATAEARVAGVLAELNELDGTSSRPPIVVGAVYAKKAARGRVSFFALRAAELAPGDPRTATFIVEMPRKGRVQVPLSFFSRTVFVGESVCVLDALADDEK